MLRNISIINPFLSFVLNIGILYMRKIFLYAIMMLFPMVLFAQIEEEQEGTGMEGHGHNHDHEEKGKQIPPKVSLWYLDGYGAFQDSTMLDTLHATAHIFNPVYKNAYTVTYLGNYGTPSINNNFFNRDYATSYFFAQSRDSYILTPSKLKFFNTHTPYSRLDYSQSENQSTNNETRFNVVHSQNITPWWNFVFRVNLAKSEGQYLQQESKNNTVSLYTSYNRDNFNIYGGFITNSIKNEENGGITSDTLLDKPDDAEYWNVNLNACETELKSNYFFTNAEYRFGKFIDTGEKGDEEVFKPSFGLLYAFEADMNKHSFLDDEDDADSASFFRNNYFPDSVSTTDEIRYNRLSNVLQFKQYENADKKYSFGKRAFIGFETVSGHMPDSLVNDTTLGRYDIKYSNTFIGGGIFREKGKFWNWNFEGKVYIAGRNAGQTELSGLIYKPLPFLGDSLASISFNGKLENKVPDYFQEKFSSKHYKWWQNLDMEQRMTVGGVLRFPKHKFEAGAKYALITNFLYNDSLGIPNQTSNEILVFSAYLDKDFSYRGLHLRTRLLWQKASEERYIHIPEFSAFVSGYLQFVWSKVMFTQIGADLRYNTKYYADAYAPSTGLFYLQNEKKYGDYPYIDIYATLRLKRTKVFFKYMNLLSNSKIGYDGEYMTSPHYPMNRATFRLGVSWSFYD